ncbi:MAG: hypothetical protein EOP92_29190 [Lysobacteraceae bacterium]|nr:MAG: hypothetical protein EOP92_29190 [Xanthomonadaceae bacterium]
MMPEWLAPVAQALFWVVTMTLLMRWLGRSRQRGHPTSDGKRVRHPPGILAVGVITLLFFVGVVGTASIWPDDGVNVWFYAFFAGMILMSAYIVADYYYARHVLTEDGMDFGRPTGRRVAFRWSEVRTVRFSTMWNWFRIELQSGEVVHVSAMMMGLPALAREVLRQVPEARIDRGAFKLLENAAKDVLPPVWG